MTSENIYQHFHPEERRFIDRCVDWINQVEQSYSVITTHFLNPRECQILQSLVNKREVHIFSSQDFAVTELSKMILAPQFYILDVEDFDLSLLEINYATKFSQISHAQVLGTFLGQTGVKRQELGDIIVTDKNIQVFVSKHLVNIFKSIDKIGRSAVKIKEISLSALTETTDNPVSDVVLVDSLRLDKIIAVSFKISRNIATNMLESNKVKINYLEINKKDFSVTEGDLISVRGFGRVKIVKILGLTKKGKQRVEIELTKNSKK
ncbi:RNA-binding protein [Lactococcus allomyrinae]|uniref:Cell division protein n=1 Tax=Lactococcus allomyrinae TaxID=2419773 RepID=A0A387BEE5_9LACT|nr:RNA-binding protein [Lactococcus allomyrinae]AYG00928.1 cell division protein [Lactococcus allomyrinae]